MHRMSVLKAIIDFLIRFIRLWEKKPQTLPHPYEEPDFTRDMGNTSIADVMEKWMVEWEVSDPEFWVIEADIRLSLEYTVPGVTFSSDRKILLRPEWANAGTLAHEACHISYALLTDAQKSKFSAIYTPLKYTDPLIKLLYSQNQYGLTNDIEAHAEIGRYLGRAMPSELHCFYPKLF